MNWIHFCYQLDENIIWHDFEKFKKEETLMVEPFLVYANMTLKIIEGILKKEMDNKILNLEFRIWNMESTYIGYITINSIDPRLRIFSLVAYEEGQVKFIVF